MAANDTDRRRFLLATALTLLALPALWWANQHADSGAPNIATAGIDVGDGSGDASGTVAPDALAVAPVSAIDPGTGQPVPPVTTTPPPVTSAAPTTTAADAAAPVFLDGPSGVGTGGAAKIATPTAPAVERISTSASYLSTISPTNTCLVSNIATGTEITVVNLNNGHSVTCIATRVYTTADTGLIMFTDTFAKIADLTDAPIPVEISQ